MDGIIIGVVLVITLFVAFLIEKKPWGWEGYEIIASWRERGLQGISAFWARITDLKALYVFAAFIIGVALLILFIGLYSQLLSILFNPNETKEFDSRFALAFLGTITGGVALFTGFIAILRTETAEQGLITDRLNKAVEGLGKNKENNEPVIEVRIGALYALERIAQDSIRDHISVIEILCAYIQENSPITGEEPEINHTNKAKPIRKDIQVALNIIGRRDKWQGGKKRLKKEIEQQCYLDLRHCNLQGADMSGKNFSNANFSESDLSGVFLIKTDFREVTIINANLSHATLLATNINNAILTGINLRNVSFFSPDMSDTHIAWAYAYTADFSYCENLTQKDIDNMFLGIDVKIPSHLTRPKNSPKTTLSPEEFKNAYDEWSYANLFLPSV